MKLNALGYQDVPPLPGTRADARRAADLLGASVTSTGKSREERELEALQGIGFALLAISGQLAAQQEPGRPARFRLRRARSTP